MSATHPAILTVEKSKDTTLNAAKRETPQLCQESHLTPGDTPKSPMDKMSKDLEPQRLPDNQAGQEHEDGVGLQRDKGDVLLGEDVEQQDRDLSAEEILFFKEFPILKEELEVAIREHRALADNIDETHKLFTKTSVVTNSVAVVSGVMSILGLVLAPATAGGSLMLSAAGQGLGTVAGATSILTDIMKYFHDKKAQGQASSQESTLDKEVDKVVHKASHVMNVYRYGKAIKNIEKNIHAFRVARAHPRVAAAAKRLLITGQASARRTRQVQKAFGGTTLTMARHLRLLNSALAGLSLGMDFRNLREDWKQLKEGTSAEFAEDLRAQADELERKLAEFTQIYESLQQKKLLQEKRLRSSSSEEAVATLPYPPARHGEAGRQVPVTSG